VAPPLQPSARSSSGRGAWAFSLADSPARGAGGGGGGDVGAQRRLTGSPALDWQFDQSSEMEDSMLEAARQVTARLDSAFDVISSGLDGLGGQVR
jgi:hypothetical protein